MIKGARIRMSYFSLLLVVFGALLCWRAWHGLWFSRHPYCGACGYDLFARAESSARCPECGSNLENRRAIRFGHRSHRRGILSMGAAFILLGLSATLAPHLIQMIPQLESDAHKPT